MKAGRKNGAVGRIRILLGGALLATLIGCVGYVDGGYSGGVVVADPDVYVFGGGYYGRGRDEHDFSHRGAESRAAAHPAPRPAPHGDGGPGDRR